MSIKSSLPTTLPDAAQAFGTPSPETHKGNLSYLPVALFGSVMGLTGLSSAWKLAYELYGLPLWGSQVIGALAIVAFLLMGTGYAIKAATGLKTVRAEFQHPIAGNLFGTLFISLLLIPIPLSDYNLPLARGIWSAGTLGMIFFAWLIISRWLSQRQQTAHATPAWIVPVVGLIDIPLAVPALHMQGLDDLLMFSLALGLFFAIPLFTLIMSRLMFEEPVSAALQPSLMILLAPFAVGFSAYVTVVGGVDRFASALYMLTLFMLTVLAGRLRYLAISCPFRLSWWAVSFPLAAATVTALRYAAYKPNLFTHSVALTLLASVTLILLWMALRTAVATLQGNLKALAG
ncbi:SLAC1 anion channel family protein [Pseudomonas sp. NPDC088368]|jgi:tellurite resistance protein|uniref:SLAC1 anion channel family protein n=1 Tax=Pseudomonas sp. NPDC088368 TaxID=3364453 RepID=UPI00382B3DBE